MFIKIFKNEIKTIFRDRSYIAFLVYPFIILFLSLVLITHLKDIGNHMAVQIIIAIFTLLNPFIFGAISGFILLDHQDDNIIPSLRITPLNIKYYIQGKLIISFVISFVITFTLLTINKITADSILIGLLVSLLSSLSAPILTLLMNSFANNKVEGFVLMKGAGLLLLLPVTALFIKNWTEVFLYIIPGFWPIRFLSTQTTKGKFLLSPSLYLIGGIVLQLTIIIALLNRYINKIHKLH